MTCLFGSRVDDELSGDTMEPHPKWIVLLNKAPVWSSFHIDQGCTANQAIVVKVHIDLCRAMSGFMSHGCGMFSAEQIIT